MTTIKIYQTEGLSKRRRREQKKEKRRSIKTICLGFFHKVVGVLCSYYIMFLLKD